jgi:WD40 repeat-containing protein SMU1
MSLPHSIHGMRTRSLLKEFRGHTSFVNAACFSADQAFVVSAGSDGTVRFWSTRSGDCTASFTGLAQRAGAEAAAETTVISVQVMPGQPSNYLVCSRANTLALINSKGDVCRVGLLARGISSLFSVFPSDPPSPLYFCPFPPSGRS